MHDIALKDCGKCYRRVVKAVSVSEDFIFVFK